MTITEFKDVVSGFMLRSATSLVSPSGTDLLLLAANHAKKFAQRRHNFELSRLTATVVVIPDPVGGDLAGTVLYGTSTPVRVKSIERAYLTDVGGQVYPIPIVTRAYVASHLRKAIDVGTVDTSDVPVSSPSTNPSDPMLVRQGNFVYLTTGITENTTVQLDIVKWLPDYSDTVTTDFLLDFCSDFMLYRAVTELNFFLKEDERVVISQKKLEEAWESVLSWDNSLIENSAQDVSLD